MAVVKDYRLMLKTVFTVRPVISRTPVRTSTGYVPREGRDQHTMECEHAIWPSHSHLLLWCHIAYTCVNKSSDFLFQYRFLCVIFFLSIKIGGRRWVFCTNVSKMQFFSGMLYVIAALAWKNCLLITKNVKQYQALFYFAK